MDAHQSYSNYYHINESEFKTQYHANLEARVNELKALSNTRLDAKTISTLTNYSKHAQAAAPSYEAKTKLPSSNPVSPHLNSVDPNSPAIAQRLKKAAENMWMKMKVLSLH